jgi:hypothetical protein
VIAPLPLEVESELAALDARLEDIARRYIRRPALEPLLGSVAARGPSATMGARRIYFDRDDRPEDLFRSRRPAARRGDQDPSEGPAWRIVYWMPEASRSEVRLVVTLAVAAGHAKPPGQNACELAAGRLERWIDALGREDRSEGLSRQQRGVRSDHVR